MDTSNLYVHSFDHRLSLSLSTVTSPGPELRVSQSIVTSSPALVPCRVSLCLRFANPFLSFTGPDGQGSCQPL
ncbi:hypothetical protein VTJ04DRAFT_8778 [Mycothermus thermophilus]|uniref:uncharacterized protein n=1 Tax=Humicola insolens TaxID=85995 RepID=UPI003743D778